MSNEFEYELAEGNAAGEGFNTARGFRACPKETVEPMFGVPTERITLKGTMMQMMPGEMLEGVLIGLPRR